ncbi:MAG: hypothetical protein WB511_09775 [Nitrososphaeraceae archaeon]
MICKQNQEIIDRLLRLKDNSTTAINRIGSYEDRTTQCVNIINELMDNYKTQNKIASTQYESRRGEVAEFQSLLRSLG